MAGRNPLNANQVSVRKANAGQLVVILESHAARIVAVRQRVEELARLEGRVEAFAILKGVSNELTDVENHLSSVQANLLELPRSPE